MIKLKCMACEGTGATTLLARLLNTGIDSALAWWFLTNGMVEGDIPLMAIGSAFALMATVKLTLTLCARSINNE